MQAHPLPFVVSLSNHPSAEVPFDKLRANGRHQRWAQLFDSDGL